MLRLLTAMTEMTDVLRSVEAPRRQLDGVLDWSAGISAAVMAAQAFKAPRGMEIDDAPRWSAHGRARPQHVNFLHGDATHKAWRDLCKAVIAALKKQYGHATALLEYWEEVYERAETDKERAVALEWMQVAAAWQAAAGLAYTQGEDLVRREDKIMRPVGKAIAAAGGVDQVARVRHYHQRSVR